MIVKKFQGETEKDAILKAQEELGNNAVVLNVKTIKQRGILKLFKKDVVEVTAALEEEELSKKANTGAKEFGKAFEASSYAGNMHKQPDISSRPAGGLNLLADEKISVSSESAVIEQKLDSLHSLLQSQINAGASRKNSMQVDDEKERDDIAAERIAGKKAVEERENANMKFIRLIYKKLVDNEVNEKFADEIMADIENSLKRESNIDSILSAVYQKIILKLGEPKPIELGDKPKVVFFIGPTGVGKTELSLRLAENFHTSIVSADSRQLYAELKIGTAAPTPDQLKRVPHYLVGTLHLTDYYSAAQYEQEAMEILHQLFTEHEVVVLTGGSMMYVDAICKGIDDIPTVDAETRQVMLQKYEEEGLEQLCAELRLLDPDYYRIVDLKNPKRVIHALEICYMTGKTYTSFRTQQKKERPFRILKIGLTRDREELYDRINRRVDQMMEEGLLDEVRSVLSYRHLNSLNTVGYKELFKYLDGEWELPFAIEKIKQNSRIYSRKQMTWFKRDEEIRWFHPEQETEILEYLRLQNLTHLPSLDTF